jgi:Rrf2 family protein
MKVSTKGRYALRFMLDLAVNEERQQYMPLKEVAQRQEISEKYLEQIVPTLNKAGFVRSIRGAQGGYRLARTPEEYSVGMIVRLMEGELAPAPCAGHESHNDCPRAGECVTAGVWEKIRMAVDNVVDHITLADLVEEYRVKTGNGTAGTAKSGDVCCR